MIAFELTKTQVLVEPSVTRKLAALDGELEGLARGWRGTIPTTPGRDVQIVALRQLPDKPGLSTVEGQARLLHDLASIELQAMELGLRTLHEFPDAPSTFRAQLIEVTRDEGRHLRLCLEGLEALARPWGSFPTHLGLWQAVRSEDALLDRVLIVHRYLEGSGLDASDTLLRRLSGVHAPQTRVAVDVIRREEVAHVRFGSQWYVELCRRENLDPAEDFGARLSKLFTQLPRRREPIRAELRHQAGFTAREVAELENLRARWAQGRR